MRYYFIFRNGKLKGAYALSRTLVQRLEKLGYVLTETGKPRL